MYGKLINGELFPAPKDFIDGNGKVILDFDTNIEALTQHGYKQIVRDIPEYDSNTQYLALAGYEESVDKITVNYLVMNNTQEPGEKLKEKIKELEDESKFLKDCLLEMSEVVYGG